MDRAALTTAALTAAYLLDLWIGDPPRLPHPVRLLGYIIKVLEGAARRLFKTEWGLKAAGAAIVVLAAGGSALMALVAVTAAYASHPLAGLVLETYIFFSVLAGGDLYHHVFRVKDNLKEGRLNEARISVAMLVSRDTDHLQAGGVSRSALESLFENSADGLVAPLFFAALGGPAAAVFYKAVSTLDSMLGYRTERHKDLGFFAAKTDDILCFIPARLTAVLILFAGALRGGFKTGWRVLKADHDKHDSPNSGWPEAAGAGVLGLKLGGTDRYGGILIERPLINAAGREAGIDDLGEGLTLLRQISLLSFVLLLILAWCLRFGEVFPF